MTTRRTPAKTQPSIWAVALLFASGAFALASIVLVSTGFYPG
jgi:hypothetical protein